MSRLPAAEVWTTCVETLEGDPLGPATGIQRLLLSGRGPRWRRRHVFVCADPFLLADEGRLWLFFEEQRHLEKGRIRALSTSDLRRWRDHGVVLAEPHHLSYPQVFAHDGAFWMLPESAESGAVWLYRADRLPGPWSRIRALLPTPHLDPTLLLHDGRWYLWATDRHGSLRLYHAETLSGDFSEHPASPLTSDPRHARCGGRPIRLPDGAWGRLAQDGSVTYGGALHLMRIDRLDRAAYRESPWREDILPKGNGWSRLGGHHLDTVIFQGQTVRAFDGKARDLALNAPARLFWGVWRHLLARLIRPDGRGGRSHPAAP